MRLCLAFFVCTLACAACAPPQTLGGKLPTRSCRQPTRLERKALRSVERLAADERKTIIETGLMPWHSADRVLGDLREVLIAKGVCPAYAHRR